MNKQEYLSAIADKLKNYPASFQKEILQSYYIQYDALVEDGYSEDEILYQLGTPSEVYIEVSRNYGELENKPSGEELKTSFTSFAKSSMKLISALGEAVGKSIGEGIRETRVKVIQDRFAKDYLVPIPTEESCHHLVLHCGRKPVTVYLTSGPALSFCVTPGTDSKATADFETEGDTVTLSVRNGEAKLSVMVPDSITTMEVLTGQNINASELSVNAITLTSSSGEIFLDRTSAKTITIDTTSGNATIQHSSLETMRINTRSGEIKLFDVQGTLYAKTTSGDVKAERFIGPKFLLETKSGNATLSVDCATISLTTAYGNVRIFNTSTPEILAVTTNSGNIDCSLLKGTYSARITCRENNFDNRTDLPVSIIDKTMRIVGRGKAAVDLSTKSGFITLS